MSNVLITDSLFIGPDDETRIVGAGHTIERLDVPNATEDQLRESIRGKSGYILGGVERVTDAVIEAADELKVIAFTGSGYSEFIPGWVAATHRGIAISTARGANAASVAEFALTAGLSQSRQLASLMVPGGKSFETTREFDSLTLGIVGLGAIGQSLAKKATRLGIRVITSATEPDYGIVSVPMDELLATSDIVSVHVSKGRGEMAVSATQIDALKVGAVLVNTAFDGAVDNDALLKRVKAGEIRAAVDYPLPLEGVPIGGLLASNSQSGFNTHEAIRRTSERATSSLLAGMSGSPDPDVINPDYAKYRHHS